MKYQYNLIARKDIEDFNKHRIPTIKFFIKHFKVNLWTAVYFINGLIDEVDYPQDYFELTLLVHKYYEVEELKFILEKINFKCEIIDLEKVMSFSS